MSDITIKELIKRIDDIDDKRKQLVSEIKNLEENKKDDLNNIEGGRKLLETSYKDPKSNMKKKEYNQKVKNLNNREKQIKKEYDTKIKNRQKELSLKESEAKKVNKEYEIYERKQTKEFGASVLKFKAERVTSMKRGEPRKAEGGVINKLRSEIMVLGKKYKEAKSEEDKKNIKKEWDKKNEQIKQLKEEEKAKTEKKTETKTDEPKTTEAIRAMAQETQQALIEQAKTEGKKKEEPFTEQQIEKEIKRAQIKQHKRLKEINDAKGIIQLLKEKRKESQPEKEKEIDNKIKELNDAISESYDKIIKKAPNYQVEKFKQQKKDFQEGKEEKIKLSYNLEQQIKKQAEEEARRKYDEEEQKKTKTLKPSTKQKQTEPKKFTEPPEPLKEEGKKIFSKEAIEETMIGKSKKKLESELDEARIKDILGPSYEGTYEELIKKREKEYEEGKKSKLRKTVDSFLQAMGAGSSQKKQTEETQKLKDEPRAIQEQLNRDLGKLEKDFRNEYEAPEDEIQRQIWLAETTYEKASSSRDTGSEFIDNRQNDDIQTFNPNMRLDDWYETRETKYQNEYINLYNNQYRELNPTEYESKYDSFGQEALLEGEFKHNIELYDIMIKSQVKQIEHMRNQSIRDKDGKVDPSKQYTLGDYFQMFNFDDSAQKEQKGRLIDEIRTFARDNMIPMGSEIKLEDMSLESLKSIATDLEVAEDLTMDTYGSQFGNLLDLYEASRQIGLNNKILERPEIKETYIGRALKRLDAEMEGGSLKNIKSKFGDILKGMTIPIKAMVGDVGIGDIATGLKAAKSTYDITTGLGRTIFGGEAKEREEKEEREETADENIIRELERMRAGDKKFRGQDGLYYPKSQPITPYRFPEPNENYTGVRLIQNAVTNYLNDTSLYGGYYTSEFANEI